MTGGDGGSPATPGPGPRRRSRSADAVRVRSLLRLRLRAPGQRAAVRLGRGGGGRLVPRAADPAGPQVAGGRAGARTTTRRGLARRRAGAAAGAGRGRAVRGAAVAGRPADGRRWRPGCVPTCTAGCSGCRCPSTTAGAPASCSPGSPTTCRSCGCSSTFPLVFLVVNTATIVVGFVHPVRPALDAGADRCWCRSIPLVVFCSYFESRYSLATRRAQDQIGDLTTAGRGVGARHPDHQGVRPAPQPGAGASARSAGRCAAPSCARRGCWPTSGR